MTEEKIPPKHSPHGNYKRADYFEARLNVALDTIADMKDELATANAALIGSSIVVAEVKERARAELTAALRDRDAFAAEINPRDILNGELVATNCGLRVAIAALESALDFLVRQQISFKRGPIEVSELGAVEWTWWFHPPPEHAAILEASKQRVMERSP